MKGAHREFVISYSQLRVNARAVVLYSSEED